MVSTQRFLPPEWAPQSAVMLTWPHANSDWAPRLAEVEPVFVAITEAVSRFEKVVISCYDLAHREHIRGLLEVAGVPVDRVVLEVVPSNDTWARDHGPITVLQNQTPRLLDYQFNGWGGKYESALDNAITARLHQAGVFGTTPLDPLPLILEGGSIEVDGRGSLLTTSHCLLSPGRNPQLDRAGIEARLRDQLGVERILWLEHGALEGDDTDSHIDTLARFCDAHTIAYVRCDDAQDTHFVELQAMEKELQQLRDADGAPYRLVPLPMPAAVHDEEGQRLPATYANFLIINGAVLVPTYRDGADVEALERLQACFPDRQVIGIDALPLIYQYGSLHCVTMQLPAGVV